MKLPLIKGTKVSNAAEWRDFLPVNMVGFSQSIGDWTGFLRTADGLVTYATGLGIDRDWETFVPLIKGSFMAL